MEAAYTGMRRRSRFDGRAIVAALLASATASAANPSGEQIYRRQCASCHGVAGQGVEDEYPDPLVGRRSLEGLIRYVDRRMPKGEADACVDDEAERVAKYIYDAFYSPEAQARNKPPITEFSRLTVLQHKNSVADLVGSFTKGGDVDDRRGLQAEFFKGRRLRGNRRVFERVDERVAFDFGPGNPTREDNGAKESGEEKLDRQARDKKREERLEFSARWRGAVLAPDTGAYEFVLSTPNGVRLWLNDDDRPAVDAWVRSGDRTEHRYSVFLLGGRSYPLRVEFFRSKSEEASAIALKWKRPRRVVEVIPKRFLAPVRVPETLVLQTPFPPDDRSLGYERGTSISRAWDEAVTYAAIEMANYVTENLNRLADVDVDASDAREKARAFCVRLAECAFRRPLTAEQRAFFVERPLADDVDVTTGVTKAILLTLKSPRFLVHELGSDKPDAYDRASRISFALWDSLPDEALLEAARAGRLSSREEIVAHVERMVSDPRTRAKLRSFFHWWLHVDGLTDLAKDEQRFAGFDADMVSDLWTSLDRFLDDVMWSEASDFRRLMVGHTMYLNGRLARYYGVDPDADVHAPFTQFDVDPERRAGVLTHPLLMAGFAYHETSSPIHRGVFVARNLLGRRLRPPPDAVTPIPPDMHPDLSTRERIALQTQPVACQSCHAMINPLGFAFEHFDAVGRYRTEEDGREINATGFYELLGGETVRFRGARELGAFLARSAETQDAFIERLFQYVVKQPMLAFGLDLPNNLRETFVDNDYNMRRLLVELVAEVTMHASGRGTSKDGRLSTASP